MNELGSVEEVREVAERLRAQLRALRKLVEGTLDASLQEGDTWERETSEAEPEPSPDSIPQMREPTEEWELQRLESLRAQMRRNWPSGPMPFARRKLPTR